MTRVTSYILARRQQRIDYVLRTRAYGNPDLEIAREETARTFNTGEGEGRAEEAGRGGGEEEARG